MSQPLDDLMRAVEQIRKLGPLPQPFDSVENHDGLAVFKRGGRVVGWMNWDDFQTAFKEMEARK